MPICCTALPRPLRQACLCLAALLALSLVGCEKSEPEASADSTQPAALMRVVFANWSEKQPVEIELEEDNEVVQQWMLVRPEAVVQLSPQAVVLVASGSPANENGDQTAGHATPGNLGAYWFQQREGRWYLTQARPSFAQTGFTGDAGKLSVARLDASTQALIVENGSCWQGFCGSWLDIFGVGADNMKRLLRDDATIALWASSTGVQEHCSDVVEKGLTVAVPASATSVGQCFEVTGRWSLKPRKGVADLVLEFSGAIVDDTTTTPTLPPQASAPAADASTPGAEAEEWLLVRARPVKETAVYRFANGAYSLVRGKNPVPGF
ncbi:MAG: hypothetical protein QM776_05055 [Rhodocyclaceae bacterium]